MEREQLFKRFLIYFTAFLVCVDVYALQRGFGIILGPLADLLQMKRSAMFLIPVMYSLGYGVAGTFTSIIVDKYPRKSLIIGALVYCVCLLSCALFITHYYVLLTFYFFMSMGSYVLGTGVWGYLMRTKGFGTTWDCISPGVARTVGPLILTALATFFLQFGVDKVLFALCGTVIISASLFYIVTRSVEVKPNTNKSGGVLGGIKKGLILLKDKGFRKFVGMLTMNYATLMLIGANAIFILRDYGLSKNEAMWYFSLFFLICGVSGRFIWAAIGYYVSNRFSMITSILLLSIGMVLLTINLNCAYIGLILLGMGTAGAGVNHSPYIGDRWGQENLFTYLGNAFTIATIVSAILIYLTGQVYEITKSYSIGFRLYAILPVLASVYFFFEKNINYVNQLNGRGRKQFYG